VITSIIAIAFLHDLQIQLFSGRSFASCFEQITDNFVTDGCDTDLLSLLYQFENHVRAGEGLARPWRTLNRQHRPVEQRRDLFGSFEQRQALKISQCAAVQPGHASQQELTRGCVSAVAFNSVIRDPVSHLQQTLAHGLRVDDLIRYERSGMRSIGERRSSLNVDR
jgi:hypothetical protein